MTICRWIVDDSGLAGYLVTMGRLEYQLGLVVRDGWNIDQKSYVWCADYYGGPVVSSCSAWRKTYPTRGEAMAAIEAAAISDRFLMLPKKLEVFI
jgi:hypothetical protein